MCSMFAVTKNERKEHRIAVNARTEKFQHIEVFDKPALFTNGRIARDTVPKGWYCYDIRGSDDDPGELCYMEENVVVNHAGSVLMPEKLAMPKSGRLDVRDELGFLDEGDMTLREFCEVHQLSYPAENMKFHIRPARPEEAGLFYTPHPEEDKRLGTVGHVRMDFGRSGNEFWHTWWPRGPEELNSPAFKAELQEVVDTLRESVLKNRFAMERFCYEHGGKISSGWTQNYGYIVETEHYRYCLRCNPSPGDYNCYCTAYDLDVQRQNMARDKPLVGRVTYANGDAQEFTEFFKEDNPHYTELKNVLSDEEYASARESTLTAFYTPPVVIKAVYSALENMHFQTGNVLEPSCGIGNFMGLVPESMNDAKFYGVELDSISGRIAQQLYQKNSIAVQGFENTNLPDSFFDAAIGNVPFGQFKVPDKRYDKHNFLIHDYFFARTLDKVRPGGVIAFITSKGTLDKENPNVRKYIAQRADLLGAIRLPNDTFKAAAGTEVTSDIIFLQKRDRLVDIEPDWVHLATDANGIRMNAYFVDNPEMVLGDMQMVSGPHGMEPACIAYENAELGDLLRDAIQNIHAEITEFEIDDLEAEDEDLSIPADPDVRNFSFTVVDGKIYYRENSRMNPVDVSATAESRIKGMIAICDCVRTLIEYQTEDYPDADIKAEQEKLNRLYDDFSKKYGLISARANNSAFNSDSSYCLLASLEVLDDEGNFLRKADMFSKRTIKQKVTVQSVDTASEAYALSLAEKARIDMPYMSQLTAKTEQELFEDLKGVIFLNPMHISEEDGKPKYLPADEYVTENTFDSYLYQLVESKQKFIGQIMTSKSPVRSAEDIDETALSYAEIKALCAGNPHIKEKMDLDIDVSRLKLLKANHLSQRYALEDQILKEFPQKIKSLEQRIEGYQTDIDQRKRNTKPNEDGFSPMIMPGGTVREKKAAGDAILGLCKSMTSPDPIPIGQYRGFDMELSFDTFSREYKITLIHQLRHTVTLGTDIFGNIQRLDNTLSAFEERMAACVEQLENTRVQLENAKAEVQKPFPQEEELKTKSARLNELNAMLNFDKRENEIVDGERGEEEPQKSSADRER